MQLDKERYKKKIAASPNLKFGEVVNYASYGVPDEYRGKEWTYFHQDKDDRGSKPINDWDGLALYLVAYGIWHKKKLDLAFSHVNLSSLPERINIVDWGCGQGLATYCFLDYLEEHGKRISVDQIILIEPSPLAIEYAELYLSSRMAGASTKVKPVCKYFDALDESDLALDNDLQTVHLYSNILDVYGINMKRLSSRLSLFNKNDNLLISVSPCFPSGNVRFSSFFSYLDYPKVLFSDMESDKQKLGFTYNIRICSIPSASVENIARLSFYTAKQFFSAYRLDIFNQYDRELFWPYCFFDVYAPFEMATSYTDDPEPVFAVLSNMISRGLPTRTSPFIEEVMSRSFEWSIKAEKYGAFSYDSNVGQGMLDKAASLLKAREMSQDISPLVFTPIAVSRIQKTVVEALITGHLKLQDRWEVLVEEADVPCAALAFTDLEQMFNHLTSLSADFCGWTFPEVKLTVVNSHFPNSDLHLQAQVYANKSEVPEKEYDLVIDYSSAVRGKEEYGFAKYKVKTDCYFAIFSSDILFSERTIYTTDLIRYKPVSENTANGESRDIDDTVSDLEYFLRYLFRKKSFRMGQTPILNRALRNLPVIGLLPTGGGKSLTYQLASLLQPGVTVIIDPLRSLMRDQYDGLIANGIDFCTFIDASLTKEERDRREYMIEKSRCLFAFMSPERLCIYGFRKRLQNMHESNVYFSYGVIDEVHCVSEWGQDFRFTYLHLGRNLYNFVRSKTGVVSLFGLTATASFDVLADVERELSGNGSYDLDSEVLVRCEDTNRLELQYHIVPVEIEFSENKFFDPNHHLDGYPRPYNIDRVSSSGSKSDALMSVIEQIPTLEKELMSPESKERICRCYYERQAKVYSGKSADCLSTRFDKDFYSKSQEYPQAGIVFCPHKRKTDVAVETCAGKVRSLVPDVGIFYSSDDTDEDDSLPMKNMVLFRDNKSPLMVATKAFGMGIDKPNVRFTVNMNYSSSLESFVQEAGRAGRDRSMALSTILVSDYRLAMVRYECPETRFPMKDIKGYWFKEKDLDRILSDFNIYLDRERDLAFCNPRVDLVRVLCPKINKPISQCKEPGKCDYYRSCKIRILKETCKGWLPYDDAIANARNANIKLAERNIEYQSPDYGNMMYFYNSNFPGDIKEKRAMDRLMSHLKASTFLGDNAEEKSSESRIGFLDTVLSSVPGTEVVSFISYDIKNIKTDIVDDLCEGEELPSDEHLANKRRQDIVDRAFSKAIYRMCCIGLIDDFTRDYPGKRYRVVCRRKQDGEYFRYLKDFLMRYYPEKKAEEEVRRAKTMKGENEVHRCLGYLTEFIYEKLAVKKKRAIDDIRTFCNIGLETGKDWKEVNEDLKDYIYYYFNSKFAKEDYVADNGQPYSLTVDTDYGKEAPLYAVEKYIRVVDDEICGASGNPIDNIKHLQGAVRLIIRSLTRENPVIHLLNVYCILQLQEYRNNPTIKKSLEDSYAAAYVSLWDEMDDKSRFYGFLEDYKNSIFSRGADPAFRDEMELIELNAEIGKHRDFLSGLSWAK